MKPSRNQPCYCGSGRKYKKCCWLKDTESNTVQIVSQKKIKPSEFNILKEVEYIITCAKNEEDKIVSLGNFILFSTFTGDAWLLERREHLALCLMQDGEENSYIIEDAPQNFMIGWNAQYHIDGDKFIIRQRDGKIVVKSDYPAKEISNFILE